MKTLSRDLLYWTPRALCLLFAGFISLFALDVFEEHSGVRETAVALTMHLVPTVVLLGVLVVAWRREWVGAVVYPALGAAYVVSAWGRFPWPTYALVAGPLFVMGALFFMNWRRKAAALGTV